MNLRSDCHAVRHDTHSQVMTVLKGVMGSIRSRFSVARDSPYRPGTAAGLLAFAY